MYNLMTASTTVPLELVVPVTVVIGSVKSMVFKFPTDEECFTYAQTGKNNKITLNKEKTTLFNIKNICLYIICL